MFRGKRRILRLPLPIRLLLTTEISYGWRKIRTDNFSDHWLDLIDAET